MLQLLLVWTASKAAGSFEQFPAIATEATKENVFFEGLASEEQRGERQDFGFFCSEWSKILAFG